MKIKEGIIIQKIESEYILIDSGIVEPAFHGMIKLNETSKQIIDLLSQNDLSMNELVDEMLKIYDAPKKEIEASTKEFIKALGKTPILIK